MARWRIGDGWVHPWIAVLLVLVVAVVVARAREARPSRRRALSQVGRALLVAHGTPRTLADAHRRIRRQFPTPFDDWFLDEEIRPDFCAFDRVFSQGGSLDIRRGRLSSGLEILLSPLDLAFLGWTATSYHLNPHFLLGVMAAESAGDCSAVSFAGAQGCFQITYTQGAGQLLNSYPERLADWYWAPRAAAKKAPRARGQSMGYWPADLYIPPEEYFGRTGPRGSRQLRMTRDPVATLLGSRRYGDTQVSSVANFSFGVIGAGLYFHYLNHYLFHHVPRIGDDIRALVRIPTYKSRWMAAAYNQGSPRTIRQLDARGPVAFFDALPPDVRDYATRVVDYCGELQSAADRYDAPMTWGAFSEFLQQLRWTYSNIPIDWEGLRSTIRREFFSSGRSVRLDQDGIALFERMREVEPLLAPETPILDHEAVF